MLAIILAFALVWAGIRYLSVNANNFPDWTGLGERRYTTQPNEVVIPAKTLWDWFGIFLAILAGLLISYLNQINERKRTTLERDISLNRQYQTTLEKYIDSITELILNEGLGPEAKPEVKDIARTQTLIVLRDLDGKRNRQVIQFLKEANLLEVSKLKKFDSVEERKPGGVHLRKAELSGVDFSGVNLDDIDLRGANLNKANLRRASFNYADLSNAWLINADLSMANMNMVDMKKSVLRGANFYKAHLAHVKFNDAHMHEANLSKASFLENDFRGVWFDKLTKWPPYFNPTAEKVEPVKKES